MQPVTRVKWPKEGVWPRCEFFRKWSSLEKSPLMVREAGEREAKVRHWQGVAFTDILENSL